jgi:putative resolvase
MYSPAEFAHLIGKSVKTLQRWDREGRLIAHRSPTNRRYYTHDQYLAFIGVVPKQGQGKSVVYARVSSAAQKPDLANQIAALEQFCIANGYAVDDWHTEIGSGLNYTRPKFSALFREIESGQVRQVIVAHQDRLIRFGFEWFAQFAEQHGCTILVMNQRSLSPEEEVTQDLLTIIHCFSSRLYGLRNITARSARC